MVSATLVSACFAFLACLIISSRFLLEILLSFYTCRTKDSDEILHIKSYNYIFKLRSKKRMIYIVSIYINDSNKFSFWVLILLYKYYLFVLIFLLRKVFSSLIPLANMMDCFRAPSTDPQQCISRS